MNKRKLIFSILTVVILVITLMIILIVQQKSKNIAANNQVVVREAVAENQTIVKQLSGSLQVSSGLTEKVELHATYYFSELLIEKNTYVKEGTNLLKYTNGTYLTSPYDLVITNYSLPDSGEMCTNSHYIEVQTTETLSSTIEINESDMEYITLGKGVEVVVNAFPEMKYKGYITEISGTATNSKFTTTVTFINDGNMKLGMSGYCTITLQEVKDVVVVPVEAINVKEDDTKYVLAINDKGETSEMNVETGVSNSKYVEIKSGLSVGQKMQYIDVATGKIGTTSNSTNNNQGGNQPGGLMMLF